MNSEQLWETTMDPSVRKLQRICIDDLTTDEEMIMICMGEEVAPRREFIMQKAMENSIDVELSEEEYVEIEEM